MPKITKANFDQQAQAYLDLYDAKKAAEEEMGELKERFVEFLSSEGDIPETGKKSFAYASEQFRALASFGQTTKIDPEAAEKFWQAFTAKPRTVALEEIVEIQPQYVILPGALQALQDQPKKLRDLFGEIQKIKDNTPSLKIERAA
jgi:hypothetical protein